VDPSPFNPSENKNFDVDTWVDRTEEAFLLALIDETRKVAWASHKMEPAAQDFLEGCEREG